MCGHNVRASPTETYNQLNAYFATMPGNYALNLRKMYLLNTNYADLSFLFTILPGEKTNAFLDTEYLAVPETDNNTPYYLNLHNGEVAHTLILGMTGSGKSYFCNFLLQNAQKYAPLTFIFDIGGSFESLTTIFGGSYLNVGQEARDFKWLNQGRILDYVVGGWSSSLGFTAHSFGVTLQGGYDVHLRPCACSTSGFRINRHVRETPEDRPSSKESVMQITSRLRGPWTPRMRVISMSAVAEGPEIKVRGDVETGAKRANACGTERTNWPGKTTHR
jgi:hypothetical protein